jgi:hypothetical protein
LFTGLLLLKVSLVMTVAFPHAPVEYDFGGKSEQFAIKESGKRQGMVSLPSSSPCLGLVALTDIFSL